MPHSISVSRAATFWLAASLSAQALPDLRATSCSISPDRALAGATVQVNYDVVNQGSWGTAVTWEDRILLSPTTNVNDAQVLWSGCRFFPNFILPGQSYSQFNANPTIPVSLPNRLGVGVYYIGYQCNPSGGAGDRCGVPWQFRESSTANNVAWALIQIDGVVDLAVSEVGANPQRWLPGMAVDVSCRAFNVGGNALNGSFYVDFFLSLQRDTNGVRLTRLGPITVAGGGSLPLSAQVTVPQVPFGAYFLVAQVDSTNAVDEMNESNNLASAEVPVSPLAAVTPFGQGCPGTTLCVTAPLLPRIGEAGFGFDVTGVDPIQVTLLYLGISRTQWLNQALPLDLTGLGMTGCALLVSPDLEFLAISNRAGVARIPLSLPEQTWLWGTELHAQVLSRRAAANPFGVTASAALTMRVGL